MKIEILRKYRKLTWKQKEALNILAMEYITRTSIDDRPSPQELINKVTKENLTIKWTDEMIEKNQIRLLEIELLNYRRKNVYSKI